MNETQNIELLTYQHETREKLKAMIKDWEDRVPQEEDDTLYTLALRRALDVVDGVDVDLGP